MISEFIDAYHRINDLLWRDYRNGTIDKENLRLKRFTLTLEKFGIRDMEVAKKIGIDYLDQSPEQTILLPHAREILQYLSACYSLSIITNGFYHTQISKLKNCDLLDFFDHVFTSEKIGINKPYPGIFFHAIKAVSGNGQNCIMVGDDLKVDIGGARNAGIDQVYFNPENKPHKEDVTYEINSLIELKQIF